MRYVETDVIETSTNYAKARERLNRENKTIGILTSNGPRVIIDAHDCVKILKPNLLPASGIADQSCPANVIDVYVEAMLEDPQKAVKLYEVHSFDSLQDACNWMWGVEDADWQNRKDERSR